MCVRLKIVWRSVSALLIFQSDMRSIIGLSTLLKTGVHLYMHQRSIYKSVYTHCSVGSDIKAGCIQLKFGRHGSY